MEGDIPAKARILSGVAKLEKSTISASMDAEVEMCIRDSGYTIQRRRFKTFYEINKYYANLLPRILYGIQEMQEASYFDFSSMS